MLRESIEQQVACRRGSIWYGWGHSSGGRDIKHATVCGQPPRPVGRFECLEDGVTREPGVKRRKFRGSVE